MGEALFTRGETALSSSGSVFHLGRQPAHFVRGHPDEVRICFSHQKTALLLRERQPGRVRQASVPFSRGGSPAFLRPFPLLYRSRNLHDTKTCQNDRFAWRTIESPPAGVPDPGHAGERRSVRRRSRRPGLGTIDEDIEGGTDRRHAHRHQSSRGDLLSGPRSCFRLI